MGRFHMNRRGFKGQHMQGQQHCEVLRGSRLSEEGVLRGSPREHPGTSKKTPWNGSYWLQNARGPLATSWKPSQSSSQSTVFLSEFLVLLPIDRVAFWNSYNDNTLVRWITRGASVLWGPVGRHLCKAGRERAGAHALSDSRVELLFILSSCFSHKVFSMKQQKPQWFPNKWLKLSTPEVGECFQVGIVPMKIHLLKAMVTDIKFSQCLCAKTRSPTTWRHAQLVPSLHRRRDTWKITKQLLACQLLIQVERPSNDP